MTRDKQPWRCVVCGQEACRGGEFCAAWRSGAGNRSRLCATPGCRNTPTFGDLCASCTAKQRHQRTPKETRSTAIYPTGETRRSDGQQQAQYTDGRQVWWANAEGAAA